MRGLDAHIAGGHYSSELLLATCQGCGTDTPVVSETDYGATEWSPAECGQCGRDFDKDTPAVNDEPEYDDEPHWPDDPA